MLTPGQQDVADDLRYAGLALQLAGVGLAAYGIRKVRIEWTEQLGIVGTSATWIGRTLAVVARRVSHAGQRLLRWLGLLPSNVTIEGSGVLSRERALSGRATVALGEPLTETSIEERLSALERDVRSAFNHAEATRQQLADEAKARTEALASEQAARAEHAEQIRQSIGRLAGGGLRLQAWGVACLLVGITLATIPDKLATLG